MTMKCYIASLFVLAAVNAVPFDLLKKEYLDYDWLEVGFSEVAPFSAGGYWVSVTTKTNLTGEAVVFISVPDVDDILNAPWFTGADSTAIAPIVPKLRAVPTHNADGTYTFEYKLVSVNDSYCSKSFGFVPPEPISNFTVQISWLVAQKGAYSVLTNYTDESYNTNFIVGSGNITRASAQPQVSNSNGNAIQYLYPYGCVDNSLLCTVNADSGAIQQLQTSVNTVDDGRDMFLTVRAWQIKLRSLWLVLVPHDSLDPSYFEITTPETVGYIVFPTGFQLSCLEGFAIETISFQNVTHRPVRLNYGYTYAYPPGIYGMLGSVFSMVDSTSLQLYDRLTTSAVVITKEDQCASEQVIHTTPEIVHLLLFGEVAGLSSTFLCRTSYTPPATKSPTSMPTTPAPTAAPSHAPTASPSADPTVAPSAVPSHAPTASPSADPTVAPSAVPSHAPTASPSADPTVAPSAVPSHAPTASPSADPTVAPSAVPSHAPTASPSADPTVAPTEGSDAPTTSPTPVPTTDPTAFPTAAPTPYPSAFPTDYPSVAPTDAPSASPTAAPTAMPTTAPTAAPTVMPSSSPTVTPSANPSLAPTAAPTASPTAAPSTEPTTTPTTSPTHMPSATPTASPTANPTASPTHMPSATPTASPTANPTASPTLTPSATPTASPTSTPTSAPTRTCVDYTVTK